MRFAHLSDSHLGYKQLGIDEREQDVYDVFEKTVDKIIELDVDFVIHSGDLFDQSRPSTNSLLVFQKGLLKLQNANIPVFAIAGNHDSVLRKNVKPPIALFEELGLNIIEPASEFEIDGILICGIQYIPKYQKEGLLDILEELSEIAEDYEKSILVLHQGIGKFLPEDAYELELSELPDNFNYYAMGHIHDYFIEDLGNGKLVFPGSLDMYRENDNFRQFGKGFCVVDMSGEIPEVERITIDLPRKQLIETINYENFNSELVELADKLKAEDKKPMLDLTVKGGDFDSSDIYEVILDAIGEYVLNIRPNFKPKNILDEELKIEEGEVLDPKSILRKRVTEEYGRDEVTELAADLLDELSQKNLDGAKTVSENFYNVHCAVREDE